MGIRSAFAGGVCAIVALVSACGTSAPLRVVGDIVPTSDAGADSGASLVGDSGPIIQSCGIGPDGGVCACVDEPLALDPPTLYFVLDRSGSMADMDKWGTVRTVVDHLVASLGQRARFGAAVFPDPHADGCAAGSIVWPIGVPPLQGDGTLGAPGLRDLSLMTALSNVEASGGTPTAATLTALLPKLQAWGGKTYVIFATDGGPNCDAEATCTAASCTLNIESTAGCAPTGPSCCASTGVGGPAQCLDSQPTIDAVTAYASAGIPVYVLGVPGSAPYATLLDALATAGGTARGSEPQYYAVSTYDQAALAGAMSKIAAKVTGSCTLELDKAPPVPNEVNVFLDGNAIAQAGPDGWTLSGTTVTVLGKSCAAILDGDVIDVRVVAGCPTYTH